MALAAVLLACALRAAPQAVREPGADPGHAMARGKGGLLLEREDLESLLLERFGYSENGRDLLEIFIKARLLDALAAQRGLRVTDAEVTRAWQKIERDSQARGATLAAEIQKRNLTPEQFRDFLRLALVQERLARAALGLPEGAEVSGDKQEVWLKQELTMRGLEVLPPAAGLEGVFARCGELSVTRAEFARFLGGRIGREDVRESAWHLLLLKAIEKRMPDLAPEARARAIEDEIARRRKKHEAEYPTITFEQRLGATGRSLESLRRDPSVAIAALSRLWVDRSAGPEGVRSTYEKERELFEARYGEALHCALLFRVAGRFVNDLCPRTFEQAEQELAKFGAGCKTLEDFGALVERYSEEPSTKKQKGDLGWVTRADGRLPSELREAVFGVLDTGGTIPEQGRLIGPVRSARGSALLWLSARRASPSWEEMSERVHEELRRRFIEELMPEDSVELLAPSK